MSDEGPLSRWSRRKQAARDAPAPDRDEAGPAPPASPQALEPAVSPADTPDKAPAPELPAIDELTPESDYTPFLAEDVPKHLARAALRKLWRSDPVLANLDGLNDYDEDFNVTDRLLQVGDKIQQASRDLQAAEEKPSGANSGDRPAGDEAAKPEPDQASDPDPETASADLDQAAEEASTEAGKAGSDQS
jgi:hypothetical protein